MICNNCGNEVEKNEFCPECGYRINNASTTEKPKLKYDSRATISLVLGVLCCLSLIAVVPLGLKGFIAATWISIILGISGIILGSSSKHSLNKNMAIAGIIISIIGLLFTMIWISYAFMFMFLSHR